MNRMKDSLLTQLVGSYSKPRWLIRHHRVTTPYGDDTFWRPEPEVLQDAQDDATRLAIADQERAGLDVITDGEERRHRFDSYFLRFRGLDSTRLGQWSMDDRDMSFIQLDPALKGRLGQAYAPRVVERVGWPGPTVLEDLRFLKRHASRPVKMTVIGPLTAAARLVNEFYANEEALGMDLASVINRELRVLDEEGADVLQLDEPDFHFRSDQACRWGTRALDAALEGIRCTTAVHICYSYPMPGVPRPIVDSYPVILEAIEDCSVDQVALEFEESRLDPSLLRRCPSKTVLFGCISNNTDEVESPEHVASKLLAAAEHLPADQIQAAPDCGLVPLDIAVSRAKRGTMVEGARLARARLRGGG